MRSEPGDRSKGRVTLDAVALRAGVSKATASKVLNARHDVAPGTRARVQEAIDALGYRAVHAPRKATRPTVTVLFSAFTSLYSSQVLSGVIAAGEEQGVDVVVKTIAGEGATSALSPAWFAELAAQGHLGLIAVTTEISAEQVTACTKVGLGLAVIDPVAADLDGQQAVVSVSATNWTGGLQATEHLIGLGHRRIGFAGGRRGSRPAEQRLYGHLAALEKAGIPRDQELIVRAGFEYEDGIRAAEQMLGLPAPPTAIVTACDASALGVMEVARRYGLRLPEDLSIVGFDDTYAAGWASPQLTTVRQPMREMGRVALRELLASVAGRRSETHHFELATVLVVRRSAAPPTAPAPRSSVLPGGARPVGSASLHSRDDTHLVPAPTTTGSQ